MGRKKKPNVYWDDTIQQAVLDYIKEQDASVKNDLFTKVLYPKLYVMAETILIRYFFQRNNMVRDEVQNIVQDAITHVVDKGFRNYTPTSGSSFSYLQTIIRNYFLDVFSDKGEYHRVKRYEDINELSEREFESFKIDDEEDISGDINLKVALKNLIESIEDDKLRSCVSHVVSTKRYNKHYATYYLLKCTGLGVLTLNKRLTTYNLHRLIYQNQRSFINKYQPYIDSHKGSKDLFEIFEDYAEEKRMKKRKTLNLNNFFRAWDILFEVDKV